jgi:uncharacterized protein (DUF1697 family)
VPRLIVLLRGVNLAGKNRLSMPQLREALEGVGFEDVRTYLQSGNVVLSTEGSPTQVARDVERLVAERFGLDVKIVVRTRSQLRAVLEHDPLGTVATDPRLYQVTFLEHAPAAATVRELEAAAVGDERVVASGRELYAWHPNGVGRSKLAALMSGKRLGVVGTARNWRTVAQLGELAEV